jgi:hypothetical protein
MKRFLMYFIVHVTDELTEFSGILYSKNGGTVPPLPYPSSCAWCWIKHTYKFAI